MKRVLLAGVACLPMLSPSVVKAGDGDGIAGLAVLMGVAAEVAVERVKIEDKAFIETCTDAKIDRWRAKEVRVSSLYDAKQLEDECVAEAVAMEVATMKAEAAGREAKDKAAWAEQEAISDRLAASHQKVGVKGRRPKVEYLANGSMQINY
jgi:hypothetical protein